MQRTRIGFSPIHGIGVFAAKQFNPGDEVLRFYGRTLDSNRYGDWIFRFDPNGPNFGMHWVQIASGAYVEPQNNPQYTNHSCDPNCGVVNTRVLIARRPILLGEEITFDYAMTDADYFSFNCVCNTNVCRGEARGFRFLPQQKRHEYRGLISDHLLSA